MGQYRTLIQFSAEMRLGGSDNENEGGRLARPIRAITGSGWHTITGLN
jgi:hypothetical protein